MKKLLSLCIATLFVAPAFAQQAPAMPDAPQMADMFIGNLDADKDGKVSKAEFLAPHETQFQHMDKNADGMLDKAEVEAFAQEMQARMQQMQQQQPRR